MYFRLFRSFSLKQRVFGFMVLLGIIPIACFASTGFSMWRSGQVEAAFGVANAGAVNLTEINAQAYAVVMESRGIYMSRTWAEAKPYADNLERHLVKMNEIVARWRKENAIAGEHVKIAELEKSVQQFTHLRREIVRLAQSGDLPAARALGDNDANRTTRKAMNALINNLADTYKTHQATAHTMKKDLERTNMVLLTILAIGSLFIGALGAYTLKRTVIMMFNRMRVVMVELAAGNLNAHFEGVERSDEIGDFARAFQKFKSDALEKQAMEAEARRQTETAEAERQRKAAEDRRHAENQQAAIEAFTQALAALADGDLTARIATDLAPEFQGLKANFNETVERLREALLQVSQNADTIAGGTQQIASAAEDLAHRTEQQAATLEETAAALDEITSTVRKTSEGASNAQTLAVNTKGNADKAAAVVRKAIEAVGGIEKSSQQISQIIGVIDEIAFQTNLLALNAGVEAARAGDSGRGFAVVASEVRALAQRSASAAKEIKGLISASSAQVAEGVALVGDTGRSLQEIQSQVNAITSIISDIATAAREEATGLGEVNTSINQMDVVTQQNAAMVQETTAAGRSLSEKTAALSTIVSHFKTGQGGVAHTAHSAPARPVTGRPVASASGNLAVAAKPSQELDDWQDF